MHRVINLPLTEVNRLLICGLCQGYLIDATSSVECLHAFCRSCIVQYLAFHVTCPVCNVLLHKTRPHLGIRPDRSLQAIVYKMVPGLFDREMERRKQFYSANPPDDDANLSPEKRGDLTLKSYIFHEDDRLSLELAYYPGDQAALPAGSLIDSTIYLLCPASLTVASLLKLLRSKLDLPLVDKYDRTAPRVILFWQDECLSPDFSLLDLAHLYSWRRERPLKFFYTVLDADPSAGIGDAARGVPTSEQLSSGSTCSGEHVVQPDPVFSEPPVVTDAADLVITASLDKVPITHKSSALPITSSSSTNLPPPQPPTNGKSPHYRPSLFDVYNFNGTARSTCSETTNRPCYLSSKNVSSSNSCTTTGILNRAHQNGNTHFFPSVSSAISTDKLVSSESRPLSPVTRLTSKLNNFVPKKPLANAINLSKNGFY